MSFFRPLSTCARNAPQILCTLTDENAKVPSRAIRYEQDAVQDVGYDLTAIKVEKKINDDVILYNTGVRVSPEKGYYLEIISRSSISKTGWMLANGVGVIDPNYRGDLMIALIRVNPDAPYPQLPFTLCQLVCRKAIYPDFVVVDSLDKTERGEGGFGSTNR